MPLAAEAAAEIDAEPGFRKDGEDALFDETYMHWIFLT